MNTPANDHSQEPCEHIDVRLLRNGGHDFRLKAVVCADCDARLWEPPSPHPDPTPKEGGDNPPSLASDMSALQRGVTRLREVAPLLKSVDDKICAFIVAELIHTLMDPRDIQWAEKWKAEVDQAMDLRAQVEALRKERDAFRDMFKVEEERRREIMKDRDRLTAELAEARSECEEQVRLLGAGGSRELWLMTERDAALSRLAEVEGKGWVKCSERMPEPDRVVFTHRGGRYQCWCYAGGSDDLSGATEWMYPSPPVQMGGGQ